MDKIPKNIQAICYKNFKDQLKGIKSISDLKTFYIQYKSNKDCLSMFQKSIIILFNDKYHRLNNDSSSSSSSSSYKNTTICEPITFKPLSFNLKGLNDLKDKIDKLNTFKLKFEFEGLFNLLSDSSNLVYNPLWIRQQIIKDLNKFKSLKFFKVGYISKYNLKKEYRHLTYKNGAEIGHSKVYFIKKGLYAVKTLHKDDISIKVFYVGQKYKTLLRKSNYKRTLKGDKYNLSCLDAYKVLNKEDNIKFYAYCNNNCLDKKNRQLLRDIRKSKRLSRDSLIESLEDKMENLKDSINNKVLSETDKIYLELQFQDCEKFLSDLKSHDEDNSMEGETILDDYF